MQSLARATRLLRESSTLDGLGELFRELGFAGALLPLDAGALTALGFPSTVTAARITQGTGSLRGLALQVAPDANLREALATIAAALSARSSHLLWLVVALRQEHGEIAIASWSHARHPCRLVSLVCQQQRIFESDAETLCALAATSLDSDVLAHARWLDVLGREAITRRFFRTLERVVASLADSFGPGNPGRTSRTRRGRTDIATKHEIALLYVSRLIFLSFLESKGWLNGDFAFLYNGYTQCIVSGGGYHRRVLEPLFFGTLNARVTARSKRARDFGKIPYLNGGLFARSLVEKEYRGWVFSDNAFGSVYGELLSRYRFTSREESSEWSEAAIDPEMLGKAFEALMAAGERKSSGAFYTPQTLVEDLAGRAFRSALGESDLEPVPDRLARLQSLAVLDPACGSGAFLVFALERLAAFRAACGEEAPVAEIRRRVLAKSIFGVDLNPTAVWLCELRLWLSIVSESVDAEPMYVAPLPNLDRHIRVGDSLAGAPFGDTAIKITGKKLAALRNRYARAVGPRKKTLAREMDRYERAAAIGILEHQIVGLAAQRKEIVSALRTKDLFGERHPASGDVLQTLGSVRSHLRESRQQVSALRLGAALPFSFGAHFSDVAARGGFDVVIGNPPWVRVHRIATAARTRLRRDFEVYRNAPWVDGSSASGAGNGFAAQVDLAALFVERSIGLLTRRGTLAFLVPAKLWRSLAGGGLRAHLLERADLIELEDLTGARSEFDAAVYPSVLVCRRRVSGSSRGNASVGVRLPTETVSWECAPEALRLDSSSGSPWLLLPTAERNAFDALFRAGLPLSMSQFGRPMLGVKTGLNSAYVVSVERSDGNTAFVASGDRSGVLERDVLRPLVRGETLQAWSLTGAKEYMIWPPPVATRNALPPMTRRWLLACHDRLARRTDLRGRLPWWSVFRQESADNSSPRVIWADFGLVPRAIVVDAGDPIVALNSCYVAKCATLDDAYALAALINSPLAAAWLNVLAEPARGGYRRYMGWTMGLLPLPRDWNNARELLAPLGRKGTRAKCVTTDELLVTSVKAYGLLLSDVEPLLTWSVAAD